MENITFEINTPDVAHDDYLFLTILIVTMVPSLTCLYYYISDYFDREPTKSLQYLKLVNLCLIGLHFVCFLTPLPKTNLLVGLINYSIYAILNIKRSEPKYHLHTKPFHLKALVPSNLVSKIYIFNIGIVILHYILWMQYLYRFSFVLFIFLFVFFYPIMDLFYQIRSTVSLPVFNKHYAVRFKSE
eukprot:NODE_15_length_50561_cov_0.608081.p28 type:complete len:186 gc:universal NODE_15_length_50561_cov_0.608081:8784-9341(+)